MPRHSKSAPTQKRQRRAGAVGSKLLKSRPSGTARIDIAVDNAPPALRLIIGFDAEWVVLPPEPLGPTDLPEAEELGEEAGDEPDVSDTLPRNKVLSYQWAARVAGRAWSGILWTRAGASLRFSDLTQAQLDQFPDRWLFADVLAEAIKAGIAARHLLAWPKSVIAAAHWTRADLAGMADYAHIKCHFDAVKEKHLCDPWR